MQIVPQIVLDPTSQNADWAPHNGDFNAMIANDNLGKNLYIAFLPQQVPAVRIFQSHHFVFLYNGLSALMFFITFRLCFWVHHREGSK